MDDPLHIMRYLLLAVLVLPLVGALAVLAVGRNSFDRARRAATWTAVSHVGVTLILVIFAVEHLASRGMTHQAHGVERTFNPTAVPGDPGNGVPGSELATTRWSLLSFVPKQAEHFGSPAMSDVQFFIGIDGLNLWLVALTSLMTLVAVLISWKSVTDRAAGFYAWLFVLQTGIVGAFVAFDVILFYVFFELTLIPAFFLIGSWGVGGGRRDAARKFVLYTLFGSLLTLTGVIGIVLNNPTPVQRLSTGKVISVLGFVDPHVDRIKPESGPITFSIPRLVENTTTWANVHRSKPLDLDNEVVKAKRAVADAEAKAAASPNSPALREAALIAQTRLTLLEESAAAERAAAERYLSIQTICFFLLMAGFAVKIPIVPFHTWLPSAYAEAPIGVTMLLSALMAKLGTFGVLRIVLPLCPDAALEYGLPVFGVLGAAGILYGAFCAFAQRDIKLLTAYSSVSHLGFLVIALFTLTNEGVIGATLHMVNHGLATGAAFAMLAFLLERYRTLDMNQFSGLWAKFPGFAVLLFAISLAGIGLPGFNNFVSEMMMMAGIFGTEKTTTLSYALATVAAIGILLSAWYVLTMIRRVMFGPLQEPPTAAGPLHDVSAREIVAYGLPTLFCLVLGVYPQPVIDTITPDAAVVTHVADGARVRGNPELRVRQRSIRTINNPVVP